MHIWILCLSNSRRIEVLRILWLAVDSYLIESHWHDNNNIQGDTRILLKSLFKCGLYQLIELFESVYLLTNVYIMSIIFCGG